MNRRHSLAVLLGALGCGRLGAQASTWPNRPVTIKVAFTAGGPTDASIRASLATLNRALGQTVVIENVPGAGGSLGALAVLRASPDGYNVLGTTGADLILAPLTVESARYRPEDFTLLGLAGISSFALMTGADSKIRNLQDVFSSGAEKKFSVGHWGQGSLPHVVGRDFQSRTGASFLEVPYKAAAQITTDLIGGQIDLAFMALGGPVLGMVQNKRLRALGIAAPQRNTAIPDVARLADLDARLAGFEYTAYSALFAPKSIPADALQSLTRAMAAWPDSAEHLERVAQHISLKVQAMDPGQLQAFWADEIRKFRKVASGLDLKTS